MRLVNNYNPGNNNGNLVSQTYNGMTVWGTHNYTYDGLNRLTQDASSDWSESYAYDRYGNRAVTGRANLPGLTGETPNNVNWYNTGNNRVNTFTYDARGNVTSVPGRTMSYDGENRQLAMIRNGATHWYFYDWENRRAINYIDGTQWTVYVYDAFGRLAEEYSPVTGTVEHIYGLGHLATESGAGRRYYANDQLGSTRLTTDASGTIIGIHDYLPFGEEVGVGCGTAGAGGVKWTGQYKDQESCLDYFMNRYVSTAMGRFTSPDRPFADQHVGDPQSWNLYSYGRNNPLNYTDPTGKWVEMSFYGGGQSIRSSNDDYQYYWMPLGYAEGVYFPWLDFGGHDYSRPIDCLGGVQCGWASYFPDNPPPTGGGGGDQNGGGGSDPGGFLPPNHPVRIISSTLNLNFLRKPAQISSCAASTLTNNGIALGIDAVGFIPDSNIGTLLFKMAAGVIDIAMNAAEGKTDRGSAASAAAGTITFPFDAIEAGAREGSKLARFVEYVGSNINLATTSYDAFKAGKEFGLCLPR